MICDLCNRCETVRSFSAQNMRKSLCRKGFKPMCDAGVAVHVSKTAPPPTYIEIYIACYVFSIFKGVSNIRESSRVRRNMRKNIYIYYIGNHAHTFSIAD